MWYKKSTEKKVVASKSTQTPLQFPHHWLDLVCVSAASEVKHKSKCPSSTLSLAQIAQDGSGNRVCFVPWHNTYQPVRPTVRACCCTVLWMSSVTHKHSQHRSCTIQDLESVAQLSGSVLTVKEDTHRHRQAQVQSLILIFWVIVSKCISKCLCMLWTVWKVSITVFTCT